MQSRWVVDTDGTKFYVVLRNDKAYIAGNGTHDNYSLARDHANLLNEREQETKRNG